MLGYIYKIIHRPTNRFYLGSTINIKDRKNGHFNDLRKNQHHSMKLQNAWNKYGENEFIFTKIEKLILDDELPFKEQIEILRNREQYYLDNFECHFNVSKSAKVPLTIGEDCLWSKLTEKDIREIVKLAQETEMSCEKIAKKFNVKYCTIRKVLVGQSWKHLKLPIIKDRKVEKKISSSKFIELYNEGKSPKEISEYFNISKESYYHFLYKNNLKEKQPYECLSKDQIQQICDLIIENKLSYKQIADQFGVPAGAVTAIKVRYRNKIKFPKRTKISNKDKTELAVSLFNKGWKYSEIANELGVTVGRIGQIIRKWKFLIR